MAAFSLEDFTRRLLAETLFYDDEYGALGNLSLIDTKAKRERYVASYDPEENQFLIERATGWEAGLGSEDEEDAIGYALAVELEDYSSHDTAEGVADMLLGLASKEDLVASVTLLFESEDD